MFNSIVVDLVHRMRLVAVLEEYSCMDNHMVSVVLPAFVVDCIVFALAVNLVSVMGMKHLCKDYHMMELRTMSFHRLAVAVLMV